MLWSRLLPLTLSILDLLTATLIKDPSGLREAVELLKANQLPIQDLSPARNPFYVFHAGGVLAATGSFEGYEELGLIRSIAVREEFRERSYGRQVVRFIEQEMANERIRSLYLLTEKARGFFTALGFQAIDRKYAPPAIATTSAFAHLCPTTATLMRK
jgi:amino-acid N-acetyltransferase